MNEIDKFNQLVVNYKINPQSIFLITWHIGKKFVFHLQVTKFTINYFQRVQKKHYLPPYSWICCSRKKKSKLPFNTICAGNKKIQAFVSECIILEASSQQTERSMRRRCALCSSKAKVMRTDWTCATCKVPLCLGKEETWFQ